MGAIRTDENEERPNEEKVADPIFLDFASNGLMQHLETYEAFGRRPRRSRMRTRYSTKNWHTQKQYPRAPFATSMDI